MHRREEQKTVAMKKAFTKKDIKAITKFFGREVTVYDRMGLNTFAID